MGQPEQPEPPEPRDEGEDLEQALHAMADGEHPTDKPPAEDDAALPEPTAHQQDPAAGPDPLDPASTDAAEAEAGEDLDDLPVGQAPYARRRAPMSASAATSRRGPTALARFMTKVCMVMGMLLLIPGLWSVAVFLEIKGVPLASGSSSWASARMMAWLMLMCWPLAIVLIVGSWLYARQIARYDARQADRQ
jgi:hypothetical protein